MRKIDPRVEYDLFGRTDHTLCTGCRRCLRRVLESGNQRSARLIKQVLRPGQHLDPAQLHRCRVHVHDVQFVAERIVAIDPHHRRLDAGDNRREDQLGERQVIDRLTAQSLRARQRHSGQKQH